MKFALVGYGRMGREIERLAVARGHELGPVFTSSDPLPGDPSPALGQVAAVFEFTAPATAPGNVARLVAAGATVICGTTGWQPDAGLLDRAARGPGALVVAPNFSVGMNLFYRLVREAATLLGRAGLHDPYVWEMHHRGKRDAPSGTARRLAEIVRESDSRVLSVAEGGADGGLAPGALHVAALRAGSEPGSHTVGWDGPHDRIELRHEARGREVFALGAVLAAEWVQGLRGVQSLDALLDRRVGPPRA